MPKIYKATRTTIGYVQGMLCGFFVGNDERGKEVTVAIPVPGIQPAFNAIMKQIQSASNQERSEHFGPYRSLVSFPGTPAEVHPMDTKEGQKVVLIARSKQIDEVNLTFSPDEARALAQRLVKAADEADQQERERPKSH